jgi:hypothetical protein
MMMYAFAWLVFRFTVVAIAIAVAADVTRIIFLENLGARAKKYVALSYFNSIGVLKYAPLILIAFAFFLIFSGVP